MTDVVPTTEAKPLSKEEFETWVVESATIETKIKTAKRKGQEALWELAEQLHAFDARQGWKATHGSDTTLGEWLADPDITLTRPTYYRLVQAWEQMVVIRKQDVSTLRHLDLTKVQIALPALRRGEAMLDDVISDVEVLGARDLRIKYTPVPDEPDLVPDEDVVAMPDEDEDEAPDDEFSLPEVDENEMVPRGVAQTLAIVCEAMLRGPGHPKRKAMSAELRERLIYAVGLAHEYGLGDA